MLRFVLLAVLVGLPLGEFYLLLRVAGEIGALATLSLLVASGWLGVNVMRHHGVTSLQRLRAALAGGDAPARPLLEAMLAQIAGALLILPGFASDVVGLCLLFAPLRRRLARRIAGPARTGGKGRVIEGQYRSRDDPP